MLFPSKLDNPKYLRIFNKSIKYKNGLLTVTFSRPMTTKEASFNMFTIDVVSSSLSFNMFPELLTNKGILLPKLGQCPGKITVYDCYYVKYDNIIYCPIAV